MQTNQAIETFGSVANLASALGISVQAVYQWGDTVPKLRTYEIRDLISTGRHLQHDESQAGITEQAA